MPFLWLVQLQLCWQYNIYLSDLTQYCCNDSPYSTTAEHIGNPKPALPVKWSRSGSTAGNVVMGVHNHDDLVQLVLRSDSHT